MKPGAQKRGIIARKNTFVLFLVFLAFPLMAHAGGLGIAAILAVYSLIALLGFRPPHPRNIPSLIPAAIWAIMALLLWGLISTLWSPYQSTNTLNNAQKLVVGVPLYLGCAAGIYAQHKYERNIFPWLLVGITAMLIGTILTDLLTDYSLTLLVDPLAKGETMVTRSADMIQNVGHAVSVLVLLAAPTGVYLWQKGGAGKIAAMFMVLLIGFASHKANASAAQLGLVLGLGFIGVATVKPKLALRSGFIMAGAALLFAPLLAYTATQLSPNIRAKLPFSWEERVANWQTLYAKILEHPFIGHGFDAVRTFTETHTIRGFEGRALVSLHPHNAGLHLWVEVGLVGVLLACIALYLGGRRLTGSSGLPKPAMVAASGLVAATAVMASLSYGVWQDWWWAAIIFAGATISFIKEPT